MLAILLNELIILRIQKIITMTLNIKLKFSMTKEIKYNCCKFIMVLTLYDCFFIKKEVKVFENF